MPAPPPAPRAWVDPARVFAGVAAQHPHVFWLDAGPDAVSGWSVVGIGTPAAEADVRAVACAASTAAAGGPFASGWVGWSGYEPAAARAGAPTAGESEPEGTRWLRVMHHVSFDHASRTVLWSDPAWREGIDVGSPAPAASPPAKRTATSRHTPSEYATLIERCRDAIREGDAYQLCLTTRFDVASDEPIDPVTAYLALRTATPSHHGGIIRVGDVALASASPERFLDVQDGVVRTRPIKGTRPRGADAASDRALAAELLASEKERAENVMIVDLMRNDLSRVCAPASVAVERLLEVESYPAVHQLVSTVAGRLHPGTTVGDLLDAAFPAGSMTGAPKLSAMTILHGLEAGPRGVFAGCFGWVDDGGAMDLAMVIRSIVTRPGGAYVGAGGGITWRSDAAAEVAEVGLKARAPLAALGAVPGPGW